MSVGAGPRQFPAGLNFGIAVGQIELDADRGSGAQRLRRENVHAIFTEIEENAFERGPVLDLKLYRNLQRHAERAPTFTLDEGGCGAQTALGLLRGNWFVENEVGAGAEDVAHFCLVAEQGDGYGFDARGGLAGVLQDERGAVRIIEVDDDSSQTFPRSGSTWIRDIHSRRRRRHNARAAESKLPLLLRPWKPRVLETSYAAHMWRMKSPRVKASEEPRREPAWQGQ